ncbi:MAG: hypothetical protein AAB726_01465 [Patescibacteria group bacterium]
MNTTMSSRQIQTFLDLAEQKGLTPDRMTMILSSGVLADVLDAGADFSNREAVRQALKLGLLLPESIILMVDCGMDLEAMIAAGHYDWKNDDITAKRFPISGKGIVEFEAKLVYPNRDISSDDAEAMIKALDPTNPWESGKIEHLLSFAAKFPEEQRKYPIVGLGSVAEVLGYRVVPYLHRRASERSLYLSWMDGDWDAFCRFLAVRKKVSVASAA